MGWRIVYCLRSKSCCVYWRNARVPQFRGAGTPAGDTDAGAAYMADRLYQYLAKRLRSSRRIDWVRSLHTRQAARSEAASIPGQMSIVMYWHERERQ